MATAAGLSELYALLPALECKGLCAESCGSIACSEAELEALGGKLGTDAQGYCSMLSEGRCTVYERRPMICRLWGIDETMPCPFGCVPEGGHISESEAMLYLRATGL